MRKSIVKPLMVVLGAIGVVVIGLILFVWSGLYGIGADDPHIKPVSAMMTKLRSRSVEVAARDVTLRDLRDERMIASGAKNYSEMCVGCHLAPGVKQTELRAGLYPQPPNLSEPAARNPREAFWVIKHGIKMSAMPAWSRSHDDDAIWALVAFISSMPTMTVATYERLAGAGSSAPAMAHGQQPGSTQGGDHSKMEGMRAEPAKGDAPPGHQPQASMAGMDHGQKGVQGGAAKGKSAPGSPPQASMPGMDHSQMKGMQADAAKGKSSPGSPPQASMPGMDHSQMPGMQGDAAKGKSPSRSQPQASMPGMDHSQMKGMPGDAAKGSPMPGNTQNGSMQDMDMARMQGGKPPPDARDPDAYANGLVHGSMRGMDMADNAAFGYLRFEKLEAFRAENRTSLRADVQGWFGGDNDKVWLKADAERSAGQSEASRVEALWNHAIASNWASQVGVRHDFGAGPRRNWAALGVQGLAPYWFDLEATAYLGASGRTAARVEAGYDILFSQRLILQPNLELSWYGKNDPARGIGRGLSDIETGLRLRYEIRRQFAPYAGVQWKRKLGGTADLARASEGNVRDTQFVAGVRIWF